MTATDDGSAGFHGLVTGLLDAPIGRHIYACGPEPMMYALLSMLNDQELKRAWFSLHRYIKCGIGVCGACCIDPDGYRVCRDGPVFCGAELVDSEFGRYKRGAIRLTIYSTQLRNPKNSCSHSIIP